MSQVWLVQADAVSLPLRDGSVHACITSPPYWGLRLYDGIAPSIWGSEPDCQHVWGELLTYNGTNHTDKRRWQHTRNGRDEEQPIEKRVGWMRTAVAQGQSCYRCLAWAGCLGLEPVHDCLAWARGHTPCPQCFICHMRVVFAEVWRVLRDDGTLWLNIGDSYNAAGRNGQGARQGYKQGTNRASAAAQDTHRPTSPSLKPKDLCGIPWRLALALQADGWYLRSEIIWHKPNPMPESVQDRPTKAHEQVFLLSKQETYFYDAEAVREEGITGFSIRSRHTYGRAREADPRDNRGPCRTGAAHQDFPEAGRNSRSVWTLPTEPTPFAHFATFPTALAERCIRAGTSAGSVVLDPFAGSGTVGLAARALGRHAVLCDLSWPYLSAVARERLGLTALAAWQGRPSTVPITTLDDLPLFGGAHVPATP